MVLQRWDWRGVSGFVGGTGVQWFWGGVFNRSLTLVLIPGWAFVCWAKTKEGREWAGVFYFWI